MSNKDVFKRVWPELEGDFEDDNQEPARDSLMDMENIGLKTSLRVMQQCFHSPGHRASLTMFLSKLLEEGEEINETIAKLNEYAESYEDYFVYYATMHSSAAVREIARLYVKKTSETKKSTSTLKAISAEIVAEANAIIDPRKTDMGLGRPTQLRPASNRSPSNSMIPAARPISENPHSDRGGFKASNIDDIFAEGRRAAGLSTDYNNDPNKSGEGK
jgi:hypothetical protein